MHPSILRRYQLFEPLMGTTDSTVDVEYKIMNYRPAGLIEQSKSLQQGACGLKVHARFEDRAVLAAVREDAGEILQSNT